MNDRLTVRMKGQITEWILEQWMNKRRLDERMNKCMNINETIWHDTKNSQIKMNDWMNERTKKQTNEQTMYKYKRTHDVKYE